MMDSLLANIATFVAPVCALLAFLWVVAVKRPHDDDEQHHRELFRLQLENFTKSINEAVKELKEAIVKLSDELKDIALSRNTFEEKLQSCEKQLETHERQIEDLRKYHME